MIEITLIGAMLLCLGAALLLAFAWQTLQDARRTLDEADAINTHARHTAARAMDFLHEMREARDTPKS